MGMVLLTYTRYKSFKHILINEGCFCVFLKHQFSQPKTIESSENYMFSHSCVVSKC